MDYLKLVKQIREQLNSAHQKFSNQIKKDKNISDNYRKIGYLYQAIVKRLAIISNLPSEFEFYKLEAELGSLQCEVNSFQLSPLSDSAVQQNDELLITYALRIQQLLTLTDQLEPQLNFENNPKLYKEFYGLKKKLIAYAEKWEKHEYDIKSAYNYNRAHCLLSTSSGSTEAIEKAIVYFQHASACYAHNLRKKEKEQTDNKITEAKNLIIQLQDNHLSCIQVFLPSFLISKPKDGTIQSILIENKFASKTSFPDCAPVIKSSKIKAIVLTQPNLQSTLAKNIKPKAKRSYAEQKAKDIFFQPKKSRTTVTESDNFPYKGFNG